MSYQLPFSNPTKTSLEIEDFVINSSTSLGLVGNGSISYGASISGNFLKLLENFASPNSPENPIEGQLWYKTTTTEKQLYIYNEVEWVPASGIYRTVISPTSAREGDLWINPANKNLYVYIENSWLLLTSGETSSAQSGIIIDTIVGTDNKTYTVIKLNINHRTLVIVSLDSFTPKTFIRGFREIRSGVNLNQQLFSNGAIKYNGISEKAENLIVGDETIPAQNLIRSDSANIMNYPLTIKNQNGLVIGNFSELTIGVDQNNFSYIRSPNIKIKNINKDIITITEEGNVGFNNPSPTYDIDISGKVRIIGDTRIENVSNSITTDTGSIVTYGGIGVQKDVVIGGKLTVNKEIAAKNIVPLGGDLKIGSDSHPVTQIRATKTYSDEFHGAFYGVFQGTASSSSCMTTTTNFSITGDIQTIADVVYNGSPSDTHKQFITELTPDIISSKPPVSVMDDDDRILIQKGTNGSHTLHSITKSGLLNSFMTTPVGTVTPFAGETPPHGWLLCNGQTIRRNLYNNLYDVIGLMYTQPGTVAAGYFKVPDLRGRFPLGKSNMGGTFPENLSADYAKILGDVGGSEFTTITNEHVPGHTHTNTTDGNTYYTVTTTGSDQQHISIMQGTSDELKLYTSNQSGTVIGSSESVDLQTMNPSLTLNYIIFTGRI